VEAIELGVHQSNERAKALYERLGFQVLRYRPEVGFFIMQKIVG
jgi:ribosomal protein S18 acetylase RimI-like enzyme